MGLARNIIRSNRRPLSRPIVPPSPVVRVYADFGPSGKSVSFASVTPDRIVMFVYPRSGNTGLPAGAPAVTNERFQTIDFSYSGGALTSIGSGFNGFIANIQLYSGSTLLLDEPVNNNDGLTYNNFQGDDIRSFTFDGTRWLGSERFTFNPVVFDGTESDFQTVVNEPSVSLVDNAIYRVEAQSTEETKQIRVIVGAQGIDITGSAAANANAGTSNGLFVQARGDGLTLPASVDVSVRESLEVA